MRYFLTPIFFAAVFFAISTSLAATEIHVSEFGAFPDDDLDDTLAINAAFVAAKAMPEAVIRFDAGTYDIKTRNGNNWLVATDLSNVVVQGIIGEEGKPLTRLMRHHDSINRDRLGDFIRFERCSGLTVSGLFMGHEPRFFSQGSIVAVGQNWIEVDVDPGYTYKDGMVAWTLAYLDGETRKLIGDARGDNGNWQQIPGGEGRRQRLESNSLTRHNLQPGMLVLWFLDGREQPMVHVTDCENVLIEDVWLRDANGFGFWVVATTNYTSRRVQIRPETNELASAPRDAYIMRLCDGEVLIEDCYFQGLFDDGQNVHGAYGIVQSVDGQRTVTVHVNKHGPKTMGRLKIDSQANFWNNDFWPEMLVGGARKGPVNATPKTNRIEHIAQIASYTSQHLNYQDTAFTVTFDRELPEWVKPNTAITFDCFHPDQYTIRNTVMRDVRGSGGSVPKTYNVLIEGCSFINMNRGIYITSRKTDFPESTPPHNITIRNNLFDGWKSAAIYALSNEFDGPVMHDIVIENNIFCNPGGTSTAINLNNVRDVLIHNNLFENIPTSQHVRLNSSSTENVTISEELAIISFTLAVGTVSTAYNQMLAAHFGTSPYFWSIASGALPDGLDLNPTNGEITGTPSLVGVFDFTVQVDDSASPSPATTTRNFSLSIEPEAIPDGYLGWISSIDWDGMNSSPTADPDGDGPNNFLEYAFGRNPLLAEADSLLTIVPNNAEFEISFYRASAYASYTVQSSTNLDSWTDVVVNPGASGQTVTAQVPVSEPLFVRVLVSD